MTTSPPADGPSAQTRPRQVGWACALAVFFSLFVLVTVTVVLADWGAPALRAEAERQLDESPFDAGLSVDRVLMLLRYSLMAVAAACTAALVAAVWTARGHRGARLLLTVLAASTPLIAVPLGWSGLVLAAAGVACAFLLWSRPARRWFGLASGVDGAPLRPATPSSAQTHSPGRLSMSHPSSPTGDQSGDGGPEEQSGRPPQWSGSSSEQGSGQYGQPSDQQYGQPQYGQSGHDQQYGQPSDQQYGQPQYGQYGQPQYGQYGQPQYGQYGQPYGGDPAKRPGAVTTAATITFVLSGLALVGFLFGGIAFLAARDRFEQELANDANVSRSVDQANISTVVTVTGLLMFLMAFLAVVGLVLAYLVLKGQGWARITLIVLSALTAVVSLLFFVAIFPLLWTIGAIAVVVLLSLSTSGRWFALRGYEGRTG